MGGRGTRIFLEISVSLAVRDIASGAHLNAAQSFEWF
ncbi:hypothetical protein J2T08_003358 [Neorhizobium galegae]|nr:hypothetical protein [Neorhizobium galegae]MDQ0135437.1 hypothetical protein [Neorhizobium galegae]